MMMKKIVPISKSTSEKLVNTKTIPTAERAIQEISVLPTNPDLRQVRMTRSCRVLHVCLNIDHMIEFVEYCSSRVVSSSCSSSFSTNVPPTITRLLQSKACRGAIMFGDEITTCQARGMISQLAKCRLPFQCAHGRPSVQVLSAFRRNYSSSGSRNNNKAGGCDAATRTMKAGSILDDFSISRSSKQAFI